MLVLFMLGSSVLLGQLILSFQNGDSDGDNISLNSNDDDLISIDLLEQMAEREESSGTTQSPTQSVDDSVGEQEEDNDTSSGTTDQNDQDDTEEYVWGTGGDHSYARENHEHINHEGTEFNDQIATFDSDKFHIVDAGDGDDQIAILAADGSHVSAGAGDDLIISHDEYYNMFAAIEGGEGNDTIAQNSIDTVYAGPGNDLILMDLSYFHDSGLAVASGDDGDDTIYAGQSLYAIDNAFARLSGGNGADEFAIDLEFHSNAMNAFDIEDTNIHITDFDPSQDNIYLRVDEFSLGENAVLETSLTPTDNENEYILQVSVSNANGDVEVGASVMITSTSNAPLTTDQMTIVLNQSPEINPTYFLSGGSNIA